MSKFKLKTLWISVGISFLVAIGLIFLVTLTEGFWTNVVIVLIAAVFIYMTIAIQIASSNTFKFKAKSIVYPTKAYTFSYHNVDENLKKRGYKLRNADYGQNYLKVDGDCAYKVVIVRNNEKYFNQEETTTTSSGNDLAKCNKFIGLEIFIDYNEDTIKKLPDFCLQGENVYYAGFYYDVENKKLICANYIEPSEVFRDLLGNIHHDINIEELNEDVAS